MWNKLKELFEAFFICGVAFAGAIGLFLLVLIVQPTFWLAVIAIVLIMNL